MVENQPDGMPSEIEAEIEALQAQLAERTQLAATGNQEQEPSSGSIPPAIEEVAEPVQASAPVDVVATEGPSAVAAAEGNNAPQDSAGTLSISEQVRRSEIERGKTSAAETTASADRVVTVRCSHCEWRTTDAENAKNLLAAHRSIH